MGAAACVWHGPLPGMPAELADPALPFARLPTEALDADGAWQVLGAVMDPEVPAISIVDLGIVRELTVRSPVAVTAAAGLTDDEGPGLHVVLTPTYSGCPATEAIAAAVRQALSDSGFGSIEIELRRAPAWSTDWISPQGRERLLAAGIAPPPGTAGGGSANGPVVRPLHWLPPAGRRRAAPAGHATTGPITPGPAATPEARVACPRCASEDTECLSAFGSTACKALYRCRACAEPFEFFKPL